MRRSLLIYTLVIAVIGFGLYVTLEYGRRLAPPPNASGLLPRSDEAVARRAATPSATSPGGGWTRSLREPLARLLLQLIVIVLATRTVGALFRRFKQPAVIGEMAAGIMLGPSLFGWAAPELHQMVFPPDSFGALQLLSQIGVCLYLFVVGMDLDLDHLHRRAHTAVVVSHASIVFPCFLGVLVSLWLYSKYAAAGVGFMPFALFMGIAMSITAFPVLARILEERGQAKTELGTTAIACAAVDDVTAWILLAVIVAAVRAAGFASTAGTLLLVGGFIVTMLVVVRPNLPTWLQLRQAGHDSPGQTAVARTLLLILASALATEIIGIHALFGAFLAGVIMPAHPEFRRYLSVGVEQFSSVFLLPLFFACTGLRTEIGLLSEMGDWICCVGLILVATAGKLGGSMVAAKLTGMGWRQAFSLGALMNTRGLMELIALNVGYDLGILSPRIFAMMVLMALATTVMTGPLLGLAEAGAKRRRAPDFTSPSLFPER